MTTSPTEGDGSERSEAESVDGARSAPTARAMIFGTGLIGGSMGLALRQRGWHVSGVDTADGVASRAVELGALSAEGVDTRADLVVVATPVHVAADVISGILSSTEWNPRAVITDVGSVKGTLVASIDHPLFIGGHPMAGSEQVGVDGASGELFVGATWVLTPTATTDPAAYTQLRNVLADVGADVVALAPAQHDSLVAVVSHVPHLTAATLMALAADLGEEHAALLQLAAGGFRDMTRIAAGQPSIWPDICDDNAQAIVETFDLLIDALVAMRRRVADHDHASLLEILGRAATARRALADDSPRPEGMVEVRVPVPDRIGVIAEITTLATELAVSLFDIEIAHSVEGDRGVLVLVVDGHAAPALLDALTERGYRSSGTPMGPTR
ncbi:MAG TPA: prephenate dehydrogenase/arogenate dehydrogenase family protein [Acidimicrobiales bacterium]|nr:prephenate dehydrogenase/arogenate dehydrogenase family protein [Acidimicrobiales bacterium]